MSSIKTTALGTLLLAALATSSAAFAEDLTFTVHNHSSTDVVEFYASPVDVHDWEEDILDVDVLAAGESAEVTIADGRTQCTYDVRFVFEGGAVVDREGEDLCKTGSFTISD